MSNVTINQLPTASTIDPTQDYLPIYTASATATQGINRNTLLGLASAPVGLTDSQTLSSKTLTSPTINGATFSGTLLGTYTIGGTPTFPSSVTQNTATQTLTNKTLTSPTINSPTITNATLTADSISGYTTANTGTIYGVSVSGGQITNAAIASGTIGSTQIATNGIAAANLATSAITLGHASITTSANSGSSGVITAVSGLTATVTIPSGGRRVRISVSATGSVNAVDAYWFVSIWDGAVGSGTMLRQVQSVSHGSGYQSDGSFWVTVTPSAGSKTYNVGINAASGNTATLYADSGTSYGAAELLVEAI